MQFVIFHGSFGNPTINWFPYLKEKLEGLKQNVLVPAFPVDTWDELTARGTEAQPEKQNLKNWLNEFENNVYPKLIPNEKLCFVGHSLGPVFILHIVERFGIKLDSAIFVSPFLTKLNDVWQIDVANESFYNDTFDYKKLRKNIPISYSLFSDNDPYVPQEYSRIFAKKIGSSTIEVLGGKHLSGEFGWTTFPLVFELCGTRLTSN